MTRIAFYGSSLLSSYWNSTATYYRGLLRNLASLGYSITFYEPLARDRQQHRDMEAPEWCRCVVYPPTVEGVRHVAAEAAHAEVVIKASNVGVFDNELLTSLLAAARPDAVRLFWDVDPSTTLKEIRRNDLHPLRQAMPQLDGVMTNGGGPPVIAGYTALKARGCTPVYNGLDPATHHPVTAEPRFSSDLGFLGNRLPDRDARMEEFFLMPAKLMAARRFILGGAGWDEKWVPPNVTKRGHVYSSDHNGFNGSCLAVLNLTREGAVATGFCPATRLFEAAGAGACVITDHWEGIGYFLKPGEQVLIARDGKDVADHLSSLTPERAKDIGLSALEHVLMHHSYANRAAETDGVLRAALQRRRETVAA
jgi:spore maturation protein CgeB